MLALSWLLTEATDASEAVMNDLSLLLWSANRRQLTGMAGGGRNRENDDPLSRCIKQTPHQDSYSYSDFLGKLHAQKEQYYETK